MDSTRNLPTLEIKVISGRGYRVGLSQAITSFNCLGGYQITSMYIWNQRANFF